MSRRLFTLLTLALVALFAVAACDSTSNTASEAPGAHKVSASDAVALIESDDPPVIIDVRTPDEYASGHIAGAINIDVNGADFSSQISQLDPEPEISCLLPLGQPQRTGGGADGGCRHRGHRRRGRAGRSHARWRSSRVTAHHAGPLSRR